jgi:hypothetical protein
MAEARKDDKDRQADALSALAAGQHREEPPLSGSGIEGHAQVNPAAQLPRAGASVPRSPPQPASAPRGPAVSSPRPNAPAAAARPEQPVDSALAHQQEIAREAEAMAHIVEDDDTWNLPAPSADVLGQRRRPPIGRRRAPMSRTVGFKQTLIPILLTLGVLLPGLAAWSFALGEESPIATAPWIALTLMGIGLVMLALAAVTMVQVKHQLERAA